KRTGPTNTDVVIQTQARIPPASHGRRLRRHVTSNIPSRTPVTPPCDDVLSMRHPQPPVSPVSDPPPLPWVVEPPAPLLPLPPLLPEAALQTPPVHSPSGQGVPSGTAGASHLPVAASQVPCTWHASGTGQTTGEPLPQTPA